MKILFASVCMICLLACQDSFDNKTYSANKESLAQRESENPAQFLRISSDDKKNLFGATVVKGKVVNTASVVAFKNTRIRMLCFAKGVPVEEHEDVLPDIIKPGTVKNFKTKYHLPKGTDSLALTVMSADAVSDSILNTLKK